LLERFALVILCYEIGSQPLMHIVRVGHGYDTISVDLLQLGN
jgi:signal transduction protein with GAF and PtsI domain